MLRLTLAALLLLAAGPTFAEKGRTVLLNAVVATGPSAAVDSEIDEAGAAFVFQFHATGTGAAKIEQSLNKTNWVTVATFTTTDDVKTVNVCGGCWLRANATTASAGNTVTVLVTLSGSQRVKVRP